MDNSEAKAARSLADLSFTAMTFVVDDATFSDASDCVDELVRMVNTGTTRSNDVFRIDDRIEATIKELKRLPTDGPEALGEADRLKLMVEEATFLYQRGSPRNAARILRPFWNSTKTQYLSNGSERADASDRASPPVLEQTIWARMHFVFYQFYASQGAYKEAIAEFDRIERYILQHLVSKTYKARTIFAQLYYFVGHCYRAQRKFPDAERYFLKAQLRTQERVRETLTNHSKGIARSGGNAQGKPFDLGYEMVHNSVFSAKILGAGLSWVALHEGRLTKAAHFLTTATTLLACTGHESLKLFMDAKYQVVERRRAEFGSDDYLKAMKNLEQLAKIFKTREDQGGEVRCARELVRGYLDLAEFVTKGSDENLSKALKWLHHLAKYTNDRNEVRYNLQETRYLLMIRDTAAARKLHERSNSRASQCKGDLEAESRIDIANMAALLNIADGKFEEARRRIEDNLKFDDSGSRVSLSNQNIHIDPVLEGECYLLAVDASVKLGDTESATLYLQRWDRIGNFVENYYLHFLAKTFSEKIKNPDHFSRNASEIDFTASTIEALLNPYEEWLKALLKERYPGYTPKQFAQLFGVALSTISRWKKRGIL